MTTDEQLRELEQWEAALEVTIEHLEGEHEGKVVVDRDKFDQLYSMATLFYEIAPHLIAMCEARGKATEGAWTHYEQPVETPEDAKKWLCDAIDETVNHGAFSPYLHGVGAGDMDKDLGWLIVAQTGSGPKSPANARFLTAAANACTSISDILEGE